ncbi:TPA: hypothetical protein ENS27_04220 [bacterium]|nr:hypothetical protein [bacterium]
MPKKKQIDPIPDEFSGYEEAIDFWDEHDTTNYLDNFHAVKATTELKHRYFEIEIDEDLTDILRLQAHQKGISVNRLANNLLRQQVSKEATKSA